MTFVIASVPDPSTIPRDARCQEASSFSRETYLPCGAPAEYVIEHVGERCYYMCRACADHNVRSRGGVIRSMRGPSGPMIN